MAAFLGLIIRLPANSQVGGKTTFSFLDLPTNAKVAALGGFTMGQGPEVYLVTANPALLQPQMHQQVAFSSTGFLADIAYHNLQYATQTERYGTWAMGLSYLDFGEFTQRDAAGQEEGKFTVNAYNLNLTRISKINAFTLGITAKLAVAGMAEYKAVAVLTDIGGIFKHPEKDLTVGILLKNIGYEVKSFTGNEPESLPFDAQLGFTYKPEHMPLRFSLTAHHLQNFNLAFTDTTFAPQSGQKNKKSLGDEIARHLVVGTEFLLSKNFAVRAGYNHLRRRELRLENASGAAGFSLGAMLRIKAFQLDYARATYHVAGASNHFTVSTSLQKIFKPKKEKAA
ncbi:MAG: type IX secretion system protein PorQ [Adhaeribacter sp.]